MMIGLALCSHTGNKKSRYLFQMPAYERLKQGDEVIVETKDGEKSAVVLQTTNCIYGDEEYKMIMEASGASEPLKRVTRKVEYKRLAYDEDELGIWEGKE